jgi:hypothetical protein
VRAREVTWWEVELALLYDSEIFWKEACLKSACSEPWLGSPLLVSISNSQHWQEVALTLFMKRCFLASLASFEIQASGIIPLLDEHMTLANNHRHRPVELPLSI